MTPAMSTLTTPSNLDIQLHVTIELLRILAQQQMYRSRIAPESFSKPHQNDIGIFTYL
jgi:hypothetical protein